MKNKREFMKPGKTNKEDRLNFVKFWAKYVKTHKDKEWSRQQNVLINSQLQSSSSFFKNMFSKEPNFKINARKYLKKIGLI